MKIPFYNDTDHYKTIGTQLIPPGEIREVDASLLPDFSAGDLGLDDDAPAHIVDVLLAGPLNELLATLPVLAREDLEQLGEREQQDGQRAEVLAAVAERLLALASAAQGEPGQEAAPVVLGVDLAEGESQVSVVDTQLGADGASTAAKARKK
ncbi:hypothetical protein CEK28_04790 [Xenophilus sp. AP218F]|nr:hypothetical protein CEK28_04790 [Xenophilus sp. AP218F]